MLKNYIMKINTILVGLMACILIGCTETRPKEADEFDKKMDETIAIHDEVMPKMGEINELLSDLETQMDSTNRERIELVMTKLQNGHESMMTWMKTFGDEFNKTEINQGIQTKDVDSLKQRLEALDKSYSEAKAMKEEIFTAIERAKVLLESE